MPKGDLVLMTPHDEAIDVTTPRMLIHTYTRRCMHKFASRKIASVGCTHKLLELLLCDLAVAIDDGPADNLCDLLTHEGSL